MEVLHQLVSTTLELPPPPQTVSSVEPYRELVVQLHRDGVAGTAILQRLYERGYTGTLASLYRFLTRLEPHRPSATVRVEREPGSEAQVDFGFAGRLLDPVFVRLRIYEFQRISRRNFLVESFIPPVVKQDRYER